MEKIVVMFLIDALRYDYINKQDSPFLWRLRKESIHGFQKVDLGFSAYPGCLAGLHPEDSNEFMRFWFSPETSAFGFLHRLNNFSCNFSKVFTQSLTKRVINNKYFDRFLRKIIHNTAIFFKGRAEIKHLWSNSIPFKMLPYFDWTRKVVPDQPSYLNFETVFDILRKYNLKWYYLGVPFGPFSLDEQVNHLKKYIRKDHSFAFIHIGPLDLAGHKYGPMSKQRRQVLSKVDISVQLMYSTLEKLFKEIDLVVFSDHGMVEVNKYINIEKILLKNGLKFGEDFFYFLDSTMARFWFKKDKMKSKIIDILINIDDGRILTTEDYQKYKLRFDHTKYGELLFLVNPGVLILPNFFQGNHPILGMHGYDPEIMDQHASFFIHSKTISNPQFIKKPINTVDLFPTVLDLLGLPIPDSNKGKSILRSSQNENFY